MAKKTAFALPKPVYRDGGYTGILFFTLVAMAISIGLLAWESQGDYDGNSEAAGIPPAQTVKSLVDGDRKASPAPAVPAPMDP